MTTATRASNGEMTNIMTTVADQHEDVGQHLADGLLEALGQVVDVVGDPAQQVAPGGMVDVAERHPVELVLDVGAQPVHGPLHHAGQGVGRPGTGRWPSRRRGRPPRTGDGGARRSRCPGSAVEQAVDDDVRGVAQDPRTEDREEDTADRQDHDRDDARDARVVNRDPSRRSVPRKSFERSRGMPGATIRPMGPPGCGCIGGLVVGLGPRRQSVGRRRRSRRVLGAVWEATISA